MSPVPKGKGIPTPTPRTPRPRSSTTPFRGFRLPTSNTVYVPNQLFDVCLPHRSRGCLRLVAYLIRRTLGWCDADGNPQEEQVTVTYNELIREAGISRDMIRSALDEAITFGFIRQLRSGSPKRSEDAGQSAAYELRWDHGGEYIKDPKAFRGFFAGEGNRTYIPNQFFDDVIPRETLAVVKVVGSVIRFSIGFQTKWGHRRTQTRLSYNHIQSYSGLRDRKTLAAAIRSAIQANYIERVEEGRFDPCAGRLSKAAVYSVKWLSGAAADGIGRKTPPAQAVSADRSENPTGIGPKTLPEERSENPTDIQITVSNKTSKQQDSVPVAVQSNPEGYASLKKSGFDHRAAVNLSDRYDPARIQRQIDWLPYRKPTRNRLGLLRSAIEGDWAEPLRERPEIRAAVEALTRKFTHPFST